MGLLEDGFPTTFTFAMDATVTVKEVEVTPFGVEGGGEKNMTNMRNTKWRTALPKRLMKMTPASVVVEYAAADLPKIRAMVNKNQLLTIMHEDGSGEAVFGWVDEFKPGAHTEGEVPTADMTLIPSMLSNTSPRVETDPVAINPPVIP